MLALKIELVNYWEGSNTVNIQGVNTARKQKSKYNNNNNKTIIIRLIIIIIIIINNRTSILKGEPTTW